MTEPQYLDQPTASLSGNLFASFNLPAPEIIDRDERSHFIRLCVEAINRERKGTTYKPVRFVGISEKVKHLDDFDVKWLYQEASKRESFGRYFFGVLKTRQ